jgi:hypothetical protein
MKTTNKLAIAIVAVFALFIGCAFIPGCLGVKARDTAGVTALDKAGDGLMADALIGADLLPAEGTDAAGNVTTPRADARANVDEFFAAIDSKDRMTIAATAMPLWPQVKSLAEAGIAAQVTTGAIGPNGSKSLLKRVAEFEKALNKTVERLE